jgi:signal transduction histidine kinase
MYLNSLILMALLIAAIGVATAVVGIRVLDADVDRVLTSAAQGAQAQLDGELPTEAESPEGSETAPGSSDTFVLYLDAAGNEIGNPSHVTLPGLPVVAALSNASAPGGDLRRVDLGGVPVRLLTLPVGSGSAPVGYVQAGFVLTLHETQTTNVVLVVTLVGLISLLGAALISLILTRGALEPIRRAFDAQTRFVTDASHELRTPAALISATAEVLVREGLVTAEGRPLALDIVAESGRLGRLVGDLLALSADAAKPADLVRTNIDLGELVNTEVRRGEPLAATHEVSLNAQIAELLTASVDRDKISQLLLILFDNAIAHAPAGSAVEVALTKDASWVQLAVTDAGPGVPVADRKRIFEPFARLDAGGRRQGGGAGLGLAIANQIVSAHGGTISVADAPGGGARFIVRLPGAKSA